MAFVVGLGSILGVSSGLSWSGSSVYLGVYLEWKLGGVRSEWVGISLMKIRCFST